MSQYANLRRKAMSNLMGEEMKAKEEAGEIPYPRGAGANAVAEYVEAAQSYRSQLSHIPYTPKEADEW